jgi:opacity protein-like surface antigen
MKKLLSGSVLLAALAMTGHAHAQNATYHDNGSADFSGPYIGGDVGYGIGSAEASGGPSGDVGIDGFNGGLFAGYGFAQKNVSRFGGYIGMEAGHEWSGLDGNIGGTSLEKDHDWRLSLRPGLVMDNDTLGYGVIGYSRAQFESGGDKEYLDGLVLGAGAEFDSQTPFKLRLEYLYSNYQDAGIGGTNFEPHDNNIKLGAVFRL